MPTWTMIGIEGVAICDVERYEDARGENLVLGVGMAPLPRSETFVHENCSVSHRDVLRGIHADPTTWRLMTCLLGRLYFVVVNCRESSPLFGWWKAFVLSDSSRQHILVPPGYGSAHLVLSDRAVLLYHWSQMYDQARQTIYRYDDPRFHIHWPMSGREPILSERDRTAGGVNHD